MLDVNVLEVRPVRKHLVNQTKQQLKKRESSGHSSNDTEYFAFLNEREKHDHDFFERLAEKEVEKETKKPGNGVCNGQRSSKNLKGTVKYN